MTRRYIHLLIIRKVVSKNILLLRWLHGDGTKHLPFLQQKGKKKKRKNVAYGRLITELWLVTLNEKTYLEATKWANVKV